MSEHFERSEHSIRLTRSDVERVLELCADDGHRVLPASLFAGVNESFVDYLLRDHYSGEGLKNTLHVEGTPVIGMKGISTLQALGFACDCLHLQTEVFLGRGTQARAFT